jgi:tRNA pseudouridine55 synthase
VSWLSASASSTGAMLGVVNLDKPIGPTSHDMVGLMRRLTGTRRIGHAGTLDPLASGVLPILVGAATRFSEELTGGAKRYDATIRLGYRSATDDAEGPVEAVAAALPAEEQVDMALGSFIGSFEQRPPAFSARKQGGQVAHRAARAGAPMAVPPRAVTVHSIDVLGFERGDGWLQVRIDVRCGPGTYIRSLARDLGEQLGCGGYLAALRRTEASGLRVADSRDPEALEHLAASGRLVEAILPVAPLLSLPRIVLGQQDAGRFSHGSVVRLPGPVPADGRQAVFHDEELLGIGSVKAGWLQPEKVIVEVPVP